MRIRPLFILSLIILFAQAAAAQPIVPDWLGNSPLIIANPMSDVLNVDSTPTTHGGLRVAVDAKQQQLFYQYDGSLIKSIALPSDFPSGFTSFNRILIAPDGLSATICHVSTETTTYTGTLFAVDLSQQQITSAGTCQFRNWNDFAHSGTWDAAMSPDAIYRVTVDDQSPLCADKLALVIETEVDERLGACVKRDYAHTTVQFVRWLDDDRLLYRTIVPDGSIEKLMVLSVSTAKSTSLGYEMTYSNAASGLFFYDDNHKAVRIALSEPLPDDEFGLVSDCTLNFLDLDTGTSTDIEHTFCSRDPHILFNEAKRELFYLSVTGGRLQGVDLVGAQLMPHFVQLDTHQVTVVPVSGVDFFSLSPDWEHLQFTTDGSVRSSVDYVGGAGDIGWLYFNLHFAVYDRSLNKVVYEMPLRPYHQQNRPIYQYAYQPLGFGVYGFEWLSDGWRAVVREQDEAPMLVQSTDGDIRETPLANIPSDDVLDAVWSPDHQRLLLTMIGRAAYVVDLRDMSTIQVVKPTNERVTIAWNDQDSNLLWVTVNNNTGDGSSILSRWVIYLPS